jgi:hypothetical protein
MQNDPYATPAAHVQHASPSSAGVSQGVLQQLAGTKPWVRFISVLMFIGAALMLLIALGIMIAGGAIAKASSNPMFSGGMGIAFAVLYAAMSLFYIYPALKLWKYANYIAILLNSGAMFDLEMALSQQRSFWKFVGIIMLVFLSLYLLVIVGAVIFGGFAAMSARP